MVTKQRWRNYALWIGIVSQVVLIAQLLGVLTGLFVVTDELSTGLLVTANAILGLLATLGIISNPTKPDNKGFNL